MLQPTVGYKFPSHQSAQHLPQLIELPRPTRPCWDCSQRRVTGRAKPMPEQQTPASTGHGNNFRLLVLDVVLNSSIACASLHITPLLSLAVANLQTEERDRKGYARSAENASRNRPTHPVAGSACHSSMHRIVCTGSTAWGGCVFLGCKCIGQQRVNANEAGTSHQPHWMRMGQSVV